MALLLKGGIILDPVALTETKADVLLHRGKIVEIAQELLPDAETKVLDLENKYLAPGLIDIHVHLREPGFEAKETIATGTAAAVRGGFTDVACMPNTQPVNDNRSVVEYILSQAKKAGMARVWPIAALTRGSRGEELTEMADLKAHGAVAFSDDGQPVSQAGTMRRVMQYAQMVGATVLSHCEEKSLALDGCMNEGYMSTKLGLKGIPGAAEEVMVARDILLAELTGCPLHICHASTARTVELVRWAKARGVKVSMEITPHHFTLTDQAAEGYSTFTKVNPPLRSEADRQALIAALQDGTAEVIASDHAPHTQEEKDQEYAKAPFGMVGLETMLALVWNELVNKKVLTPAEAVAKMTVNPARILNLKKDLIQVGAAADLTVIDPEWEEVVEPQKFSSKGRNTPFAGWKLKGWPVYTIINGKVVFARS